MANVSFDASTRREWRELGFFYDRDDAVRKWRIVGTAERLQRFASLIAAYASDATNDAPSEHQHFGPYMFLEYLARARDHSPLTMRRFCARYSIGGVLSVPSLRRPSTSSR